MMKKYQGEVLNILHTIGMEKLYPIIRVGFKLTGNFDEQRFKQALMRCCQVVPELFCKYNLNDNSFTPVTGDLTGVWFEDVDPDQDSADWDLFNEPQLRVYVNHHQSETQITLLLSHILTDGAGTKQLLYLLSQTYNKGDLDHIKNHQDLNWLKELLNQHQVSMNSQVDHPQKPLSLPAIMEVQSPKRRIGELKLSKEQTAKLIAAAHQAKVTLNDLFMAAFGRAVQRFSLTNRIALACPTDMRQFITEKKQLRIANHTARYNINVLAPRDQSFDQVVVSIHDAMVRNKQTFQCLQSVQSLVENANRLSITQLQQIVEQNYHVRAISYTNFGIISHRFNLNDCQISQFSMLGSYRRMPMFQVAVSTYCDQINFAYAMVGNDQEARLGDTVMLMMRDLLGLYSKNHKRI